MGAKYNPETRIKNVEEGDFTPCQARAYGKLQGSRNIFLTGGARTGKSFLLRQFQKEKNPKTFPVMASNCITWLGITSKHLYETLTLELPKGKPQSRREFWVQHIEAAERFDGTFKE